MWKFKRPRFDTKGVKRLIATAAVAAVGVSAQVSTADAQIVHRRTKAPDYHVVGAGDTMWDLSGSYYGDAYNWPRLWGYNAHVTNPHWIYPGDILYLKAPTTGEEAPKGPQKVDTVQRQINGAMILPTAGFIVADELEYVGRIMAAPKEANMLSPGDEVWLGFGEEAREEEDEETKYRSVEARPGDLYAVVREVEELQGYGPQKREVEGVKYVVVGAVRVDKISEKYYDTATVTESWIEMFRGDFLIPYERQLKSVQPVRADKTLVAKIVDSMTKQQFYGESQFVFVNKGAEDGVRVGNRLFVYQREEGLTPIDEEPEAEVPWRQIGQVVLLDVRKNYSMAVITDSPREIEIGDRLEMYSGN